MVEPNARIVHRPFLLDENELDDDFLLDVDSDDEVDAGSDNEFDETAADLYLESIIQELENAAEEAEARADKAEARANNAQKEISYLKMETKKRWEGMNDHRQTKKPRNAGKE